MTKSTIAIHAAATHRRYDTKPWYRQFWPWFLVALPLASVILSFFTLYMALSDADEVMPHEGDSTSYSAPRTPAAAASALGGPSAAAAEATAPTVNEP